MGAQQKVWGALHGELGRVGIEVIGPSTPLDASCENWLRDHFLTQIFPNLTPQALDPAHPFPFIPNDRKSVVEGKSVSVRVDLGGSRIIQKTNTTINSTSHIHQVSNTTNT